MIPKTPLTNVINKDEICTILTEAMHNMWVGEIPPHIVAWVQTTLVNHELHKGNRSYYIHPDDLPMVRTTNELFATLFKTNKDYIEGIKNKRKKRKHPRRYIETQYMLGTKTTFKRALLSSMPNVLSEEQVTRIAPFHKPMTVYEIVEPNKNRLRTILDYLKANPNAIKSHKIPHVSTTDMVKRHTTWTRQMNKIKLDEKEKAVEAAHVFEDGMRIIKLTTRDMYQREGKRMSNCVAGYHKRKGIDIYSLRTSDNSKSKATIEVRTYNVPKRRRGTPSEDPQQVEKVVPKIVQALGFANSTLDAESRKYVEEFAKVMKFQIYADAFEGDEDPEDEGDDEEWDDDIQEDEDWDTP